MSATFEKGHQAFQSIMDAPMASFFSSCVHCGLCADACLFYTETNDPKYTPIHKLEPLRRVWRSEFTLLGKIANLFGFCHKITDAELEAWSPLVYDSCTMCGRCSMVCPVGNDITYMIRKMREGMAAAGHAPEGVIGAVQRTITEGSPMSVTWKAVSAQIGHQESESGHAIPVDQQGADYMVLLSSMEIMNYPEYMGALAKIFSKSGVSWTISSEAFEATNAGIQIGAADLAKEIIIPIVNAAEKLQVKNVISPECGHAFTALRWEGPNLIGRPYPFKVVHILEVLDELRAEGKLKTKGSDSDPLTFHDPCQIVRRGGVVQQPRNLLNMVSTDFREMRDHGVMNWCCGGGGGVSANERADELKTIAFKKKKGQIEELGVNKMVTACANCRIVMEDGLEAYGMNVELIGLTEMIADYLDEEA